MKSAFWIAAALATMLVFSAGCSTMGTPPDTQSKEDDSWKYHDIAGVKLVQKHAVVPMPEGVLIIDSRPYKPKYVNGHIPTAISMPFSSFDKMTDKLPKDKNTLLIFYCGGPT
jgi:3-mercaptopyruvate sulfurtransferase SseA